jgi:hypothetical protein
VRFARGGSGCQTVNGISKIAAATFATAFGRDKKEQMQVETRMAAVAAQQQSREKKEKKGLEKPNPFILILFSDQIPYFLWNFNLMSATTSCATSL